MRQSVLATWCLRHRDLGVEGQPVLDQVRGVQHHQLARRRAPSPTRRSSTGCPASRTAASRARSRVERAVDQHLERHLDLADPAHAVRQARRAEPDLAEAVPLAAAAEDGRRRARRRFSMRISQWLWLPAMVSMSRTISQPVGRQVDDEGGVARLRRVGVGIGLGDEDREVRAARAADEPLVPVDDPVVAVACTARVRISVGSEPATSGSVMAKHERRSPSHSGRRYCSFCSSASRSAAACACCPRRAPGS